MRVTLKGDDVFRRFIKQAGDKQLDQFEDSLRQEAERIMMVSKRDYVPVDQGTLRASGHVQKPVRSSNAVKVVMGYGGAASAYALVQHERMDYRHRVGGPKYLEQPVKKAVKGLAARLGADVERGFR